MRKTQKVMRLVDSTSAQADRLMGLINPAVSARCAWLSTNLFHKSRVSRLFVLCIFTMGGILLQASKPIRTPSVVQLGVCCEEHILPTEIFHASPSATPRALTHMSPFQTDSPSHQA